MSFRRNMLYFALVVVASAVSGATAASCNLCAVEDENREIQINPQCENFAAQTALLEGDTEGCRELQANGWRYCACSTPPQVPDDFNASTSCTLCSDGSDPNPDMATKELSATGFTCAQLEHFVKFTQLTESCHQYQRVAAKICGCSSPCTSICPDGTELTLPDSVLNPQTNLTCGDAQQLAEAGSILSHDCPQYNYLGVRKCGCQAPINTDTSTGTGTGEAFCNICENGDFPHTPGLKIAPRVSCLQAAGDAAFGQDSHTETNCATYQESYGDYCCGTTDSYSCRMRPYGRKLIEPERLVSENGISCAQVEFRANKNGTQEGCDAERADYYPACSRRFRDFQPGTEDCVLCGSGNTYPTNPNQKFGLAFGNFTCAQLHEFPSLIPDNFCAGNILTILRNKCGCPDSQGGNSCKPVTAYCDNSDQCCGGSLCVGSSCRYNLPERTEESRRYDYASEWADRRLRG